MSMLFSLLAIGLVGYVGASTSSRNSRVQGTAFVIFASAFILACGLAGYVTGINPAKIMTGCGLVIATVFGVILLINLFQKPEK